MRRSFVIAAAICALTACQQNRSRYAWAHYEDSVWSMTHAEGAADIDAQIALLQETVEGAGQSGRAIPPGMHAHLGMLYSMRGERDIARAAFESERELYPESTAFIDGLIARMGGDQ